MCLSASRATVSASGAQVGLGADEQLGRGRAVVHDLGVPLVARVLEGGRRGDREADEEDVRLRVGQRAETVVVLLAGRVPQAQVDGLVIYHHVGRIIIEYRRDVLAGEGVGGVGDQQAGLADGTVADHHALDRLHQAGHCALVVLLTEKRGSVESGGVLMLELVVGC